MIHERDAQDALGIVEKQYQQLQYSFGVDLSKLEASKISNIVVGGMGGSALAGQIISSWPKLKLPFEVVKNYDLPEYVNESTLFIASSYSGNTEETLSALKQAQEKNAQIAIIASGGELRRIAEHNDYPVFVLPSGYQPRMAVFFNLSALLELLSKLYDLTGEISELHKAADWLGEQGKDLLPDVPTVSNQAKQLAQDIVGSSIVIYSGPVLAPAAYKWKININENAKNVAWTNTLPEFNHNEFLGWTSHPIEKPYKIVDLISNFDNKQVNKRFEISQRLLSGKRPHPYTIEARGESILTQLLWTIQLGDFTSLYLALLNGLNPTPVELIEKFKASLNQ